MRSHPGLQLQASLRDAVKIAFQIFKISAIGYTPVFDTTPILMLLAIFIARAVVRNGRLRTNAGLE
jgi:hypothetical protein